MEFFILIVGIIFGGFFTAISSDTSDGIYLVNKKPCITKEFGQEKITKCYKVIEVPNEQK